MNRLKCFMLSAGLVALSTGFAAAAPAVVLDYLNLRTGPGFNYGVIEVIPAGWVVDAGGCVAGWCQVNVNGIVGYADADFLNLGQGPVVTAAPPPGYYASAAPPYYGTYGTVDPRYAYGAAYGTYAPPPLGPNYSYYYGAPYPLVGTYAQATDEDVAAVRAAGTKHNTVVRNAGAPTHHAARPAVRGSASAGGGRAAVDIRTNRAD